jgi:outer membrane biosynthesis protein TonB
MAGFAPTQDAARAGRRRRAVTLGGLSLGAVLLLAGGLVLVALIIWALWNAQWVTERPNEMKTTAVILPPPPPPPPPEVEPEEQPPEPSEMPMEEPVDTPPPPDQPQQPSSEPTVGDSALTAREGAGPSNYGLAKGDGSGRTIGGRPGGSGNGFGAYAERVRSEIYNATRANPALQGRFSIPEFQVWVDTEGRISRARVTNGSGDRRRDAALEQALVGIRLSQRPPAGLPSIRLAYSRSGA